ncbi:hypothetical protein ACVWWK_003814 [Bradyrhizobium sp. LB9.1b]
MQLAASPHDGHDRKIVLRRQDAADSLQNDRVPIRDDNSDATHASSARFRKLTMRQFIPATSSVTFANHKANLQCQSVALVEAHLATLDRGVNVTHSEIACTTVRTRALLETPKREILRRKPTFRAIFDSKASKLRPAGVFWARVSR